MGARNFDVISMGPATGKVVTNVAAAPGVTTLPTMTNGSKPKFVFLNVIGGTAEAYVVVTPTMGGNGALAVGIPLITGHEGIILNVHGFSHIGTEGSTADCELHIVALEDF